MSEGEKELRVRRRLVGRLPELLLEAASVMFAVLVALAVDEWRDDRANMELAARARESILAEVETNRAELLDGRADNEAMLGTLEEGLRQLKEGREGRISIDFSFALLSTAAWQTAQVTQATHFMEFDWVTRVARLYDMQDVYDGSQTAILERISGFGNISDENAEEHLRGLTGRLLILLEFQDSLLEGYAEILGEAANR
jgi:hypothetical protein